MYYPLLRGKQFELAAIRDLAGGNVLRSNKVCPIIEPVRTSLSPLDRTLSSWDQAGTTIALIINPRVGDFAEDNQGLLDFFKQGSKSPELVRPVLVVNQTTTLEEIEHYYEMASPEETMRSLYFLHDSAIENQRIIEKINQLSSVSERVFHLFEDERTSMIYRRKFRGDNSCLVAIRDEFISEARNKDYRNKDFFTDLHVVYEDMGLQGFGDYQIVGEPYREAGGPAYAVALHITYIDPSQDNTMYVQHFVSDSNNTIADPGKKFSEALRKMIQFLEENKGLIYEGRAIREFRDLHERKHFPGLGFVKKLSIQHHIEVVDNYLLSLK